MNGKSARGDVKLIWIVRFESFVTIPEMWPFFVSAKPFEPPTPLISVKKPTPGESILNARSIVYLKSLAFTGFPLEYLRFGRSVKL